MGYKRPPKKNVYDRKYESSWITVVVTLPVGGDLLYDMQVRISAVAYFVWGPLVCGYASIRQSSAMD